MNNLSRPILPRLNVNYVMNNIKEKNHLLYSLCEKFFMSSPSRLIMGIDFIVGKASHDPQKVGRNIDYFVKGIMDKIGKNNITAQRVNRSQIFIGLLIDELERNIHFLSLRTNSLSIYSDIKAQGLTKNITFYEYVVSCLNHVNNHNAFLVNEFFSKNSYLLTYDDNKYPHLVFHPTWFMPPFGFLTEWAVNMTVMIIKNLAWIINYINDSGTLYRF